MKLVAGPGSRPDLGTGLTTQLEDARACVRRLRLTLGERLQELSDHGVQGRRPIGSDPSNLAQQRLVQGNGDILHEHIIRVNVCTEKHAVQPNRLLEPPP